MKILTDESIDKVATDIAVSIFTGSIVDNSWKREIEIRTGIKLSSQDVMNIFLEATLFLVYQLPTIIERKSSFGANKKGIFEKKLKEHLIFYYGKFYFTSNDGKKSEEEIIKFSQDFFDTFIPKYTEYYSQCELSETHILFKKKLIPLFSKAGFKAGKVSFMNSLIHTKEVALHKDILDSYIIGISHKIDDFKLSNLNISYE